MVNRSLSRPLTLVFAIFWFVGCASYTEETRDIRINYRNGSYESALKKLESSSIKSQERNEVLYLMEKAMILDRLGRRKEARKLLIDADKKIDALYTTSVTNTAASFVYNDSVTDYQGEDYEKVAVHTMLALSFIEDKNYKSARVEAKRINQRLYDINKKYDEKKNRYAEDAFALYLSGVIYEALGDYDDAIIDYRKALALYEGSYRSFYRGSIPKGLVEGLYQMALKRQRKTIRDRLRKEYGDITKSIDKKIKRSSQLGHIVVIHEYGHIAVKTAKNFIFPFGKQIIRYSWPTIDKRWRPPLSGSGFQIEKGPYVEGTNVQDMDAIARFTLEDKRGRMLLKGGARLLAKGQITEQAYKNFGLVGGLAANVYSAVSETADTRSWTLLPEAFYISRASLKPGKYNITIKTGGRKSQIVSVNVKPGKLTLLRDFD